MWEMMNGMRSRMMPRRRNGMGTMTALLVGASVGIAAWEAMRRGNVVGRITTSGSAMNSSAEKAAEDVLNDLES